MKMEQPAGRIKYIGDKLTVPKGEVGKGTFMVILPKSSLHSSNTPIVIGLYHNGKRVEGYKSTFVGPNTLDKK